MTRIKKPEDMKDSTPKTIENGMDTSADPAEITPGMTNETIEETPIEELPALSVSEPVEGSTEGVTGQEVAVPSQEIETTVEDCEVLYGVIMETAHGMAKKKGKGHRELPETRRKAQGKLLHSICEKYNIVIPTEFELVIFGGALIADWQYMTVDETEYAEEAVSVESTHVELEGETEQ